MIAGMYAPLWVPHLTEVPIQATLMAAFGSSHTSNITLLAEPGGSEYATQYGPFDAYLILPTTGTSCVIPLVDYLPPVTPDIDFPIYGTYPEQDPLDVVFDWCGPFYLANPIPPTDE